VEEEDINNNNKKVLAIIERIRGKDKSKNKDVFKTIKAFRE